MQTSNSKSFKINQIIKYKLSKAIKFLNPRNLSSKPIMPARDDKKVTAVWGVDNYGLDVKPLSINIPKVEGFYA